LGKRGGFGECKIDGSRVQGEEKYKSKMIRVVVICQVYLSGKYILMVYSLSISNLKA